MPDFRGGRMDHVTFFYKIKQNYILFQFKKDSICIFDPLYFVFLYFSVTIMCNSYFL